MAYYDDYDFNNDDDDLNRLLEGRDGENFENDYNAQKRKHELDLDSALNRPTKKPARKVEHNVDLDGLDHLLQRNEYDDDDDLRDFIENDMEGDDDADQGMNRLDEAIEVPDKPAAPAVIKAKRVVKNPRPKLNADTLKSRRGLIALRDAQKSLVLKGNGHELEDLNKIMFTLEHWAHRLHPHMSFDDFLDRTANLGSKKLISVYMNKIRLNLPLEITGELVESDKEGEIDPNAEEEQMELEPLDPNAPRLTSEEAFDQVFGDNNDNQTKNSTSTTNTGINALSVKQRELIAQKRLEALAKRQKALEEQQQPENEQEPKQTNDEPIEERADSPMNEENVSEEELLRQLNADDEEE